MSSLKDVRNQSTAVRLLAGLSTRLEIAVRRSRITAFGRLVRRYVMASFCYRWLTAEPDPEVIVIDLRETKTVGPIIAVLDRLLAGLTRATATSTIAAGVSTVAASGRDRPVAVGSLVSLPVIVVSLFVLATAGTLTTPLLVSHLLAVAAAALGCRSRQSLDDLRETYTARLLAAAFRPPAPPEPASQQPPNHGDSDRDADRFDSDSAPASDHDSSSDARSHETAEHDLETSAASNTDASAVGPDTSETSTEEADRN